MFYEGGEYADKISVKYERSVTPATSINGDGGYTVLEYLDIGKDERAVTRCFNVDD